MFEKLKALLGSTEITDEGRLFVAAVLDVNERLAALEAIAVRQGALVRT